jgi:dTMP kinase
MSRGKYIVLEGPEGVGKTTQLTELASRLQAAGLPVRTLREPDSQSDLTARAIRQLTQDPRYPMNTRTEVLLYNAARSQSLQVIQKSVEQGIICLVDRNYLTTLAIQYYGRGDVPDYETITSIVNFAVGGIEPDLCIILDAPVPVLKDRAAQRHQGERFDNLDEAFLERVRAGYLWEAKQRDFPVVFATDSEEKVSDNIWKLVAKTLALREPSKASLTAPIASVKDIIAGRELPAPHEPPAEAVMAGTPSQEAAEADTNSSDSSEKYHVPATLDIQTAAAYQRGIESLLERHEKLRLALPAELSKSITHLTLPVACITQQNPADSWLNVSSSASNSADMETTGNTYGHTDSESLRLTDHWPRNEFLLLPLLLHPATHSPMRQLSQVIDSWPYEQKAQALKDIMGQPHIEGAQSAFYTWEIETDYATYLDLLAAKPLAISHQQLTPRYGFATPDALEDPALSDLFAECFDASLELYSKLQAAGHVREAQYCTLLGHSLRGAVSLSSSMLADLLKREALTDRTRALLQAMAASIAEVHPLIASQLPQTTIALA